MWEKYDFQYVIDEYSTVMYVCGYMMNSEKAMAELLKRVAKGYKNEHISEQMRQIGHVFVGTRVQGAEESAMKVLSMPLIRESMKVIFVNSNMKAE